MSTPNDRQLIDTLAAILGTEFRQVVDFISWAREMDDERDKAFPPERDDPDYDGALTRADDIVWDREELDAKNLADQVDLARNLAAAAVSFPTWCRGEEFEGRSHIPAFRAVTGLTLRHLIPTELYDLLTMEWRSTVGRIHPEDPLTEVVDPDTGELIQI